MTDKYIQLKDADGNNLFPASDYNNNINFPSINGVPLVGNRTLDELGLLISGKKLLWSNPAPDSSFNGQTISLTDNADNYDMLIFVSSYQGRTTTKSHSDCIMAGVNNGTIVSYKDSTTASSTDTTMAWRNVTIAGTSVTINNAMYNSASGGGYNRSDLCIPTCIYGVNFKSTNPVGTASSKTLLWTNGSQGSEFSAQTVTLSESASNFDVCVVTARYANYADSYRETMVVPDGSKHSIMSAQQGNGATVTYRDCTINGTSCVFGNGWYVEGSSIGNGAAYCIPIRVYGIRFGSEITNNYTYNYSLPAVNNTNLADIIYPVGSIYFSINNTNPSVLFGGTWEQIKDTFLLSAGDTYTAGDTGGEAEHTLVVDELPSHNHYSLANQSAVIGRTNTGSGNKCDIPTSYTGSKTVYIQSNTTSSTGGGQAHNNMPPYLVVYMWKRTA